MLFMRQNLCKPILDKGVTYIYTISILWRIEMTRRLLKIIILVSGLIFSISPMFLVSAQDYDTNHNGKGWMVERHGDREARLAEFAANNPEAAARMQEYRQEIEGRRADFETAYPEAAAEMRKWNEEDSANRDAMREEMQQKRADFEQKFPEAIAEMKALREKGKESMKAKQAEKEARQTDFEQRYPEAAAELREMRDEIPGRGKGMRHGAWSRFGRGNVDNITLPGDFRPGI
jgi:hypothetical protein